MEVTNSNINFSTDGNTTNNISQILRGNSDWSLNAALGVTQRSSNWPYTNNTASHVTQPSSDWSFNNRASGASNNISEWISTSTSLTPEDAPRFILLLGLLPMVILTVVANILVMIVIRRDKKLQNSSNWYIFSLAIADAIVGLAVMMPFSVYNIYQYWPWDVVPCTIWACFDFACCTVSMLHLCLIALDRLWCITQPHTYIGEEAKKRTVAGIIVAWTVGSLVWIPAIVLFRQKDVDNGTMDEKDCLFFPPKEYILVQSILVYFGPIFAMLLLYVELLKALKDKEERLKQHMKRKQSNGEAGETNKAFTGEEVKDCESDKNELSKYAKDKAKSKLQQKMSRQNRRSVKVIGVVIFTFLLCWLPFCLFWPIAAFCETCIGARWYEASYWMAYLNSMVNPLLYFTVNRDFRRALLNLCGWRCCRNTKFIDGGSTLDNTSGIYK